MTLWGSNTCGASNGNWERARPYTGDAGNFTHVGVCLRANGTGNGPKIGIFRDNGGGNDTLLKTEIQTTVSAGRDDCTDGAGEEYSYGVTGDPDEGTTYWIVGAEYGGSAFLCYDSGTNTQAQKPDFTEVDISALSKSTITLSVWAQIEAAGGGSAIPVFMHHYSKNIGSR